MRQFQCATLLGALATGALEAVFAAPPPQAQCLVAATFSYLNQKVYVIADGTGNVKSPWWGGSFSKMYISHDRTRVAAVSEGQIDELMLGAVTASMLTRVTIPSDFEPGGAVSSVAWQEDGTLRVSRASGHSVMRFDWFRVSSAGSSFSLSKVVGPFFGSDCQVHGPTTRSPRAACIQQYFIHSEIGASPDVSRDGGATVLGVVTVPFGTSVVLPGNPPFTLTYANRAGKANQIAISLPGGAVVSQYLNPWDSIKIRLEDRLFLVRQAKVSAPNSVDIEVAAGNSGPDFISPNVVWLNSDTIGTVSWLVGGPHLIRRNRGIISYYPMVATVPLPVFAELHRLDATSRGTLLMETDRGTIEIPVDVSQPSGIQLGAPVDRPVALDLMPYPVRGRTISWQCGAPG